MDLASKGRFGDTEIRKIDGKLAHVNKYEAALIDSKGLLGEIIVKAYGSGTINPLTGLREYHWKWRDPLNLHHQTYNPVDQLLGSGTSSDIIEEVIVGSGMLDDADISGPTDDPGLLYDMGQSDSIFQQHIGQTLLGQAWEEGGGQTGQLSFDELTDYSEGGDPLLNIENYLQTQFGIGKDYTKYITPFEQERFGFMERGFGLEQQNLMQKFQATGGKLRQGLGKAAGQARTAAGKSEMVSVGGITQGFEQQKKGLLQDYSRGQETYALGMDTAQLGYEADVYGEKARQMERFYDDIRSIVELQQG